MKRINLRLLSGMVTAGIALSASGLGLPIPTHPLSSAPSVDDAPTPITPEPVHAISWTPGEDIAPGWEREAIDSVATMDTTSNIWGTESASNPITFSTLGVTVPHSQLTTDHVSSPPVGLSLRPMAGETHFSSLNGVDSLAEPTTFTLLALGLACLAIRDSLARKRSRPDASTPTPRDGVTEATAAHVSQGALMCVPRRDSRPFECTPITRSHKNRRRRA